MSLKNMRLRTLLTGFAGLVLAVSTLEATIILTPIDSRVVSDATTTTALGTVDGGTTNALPVRGRASTDQDGVQVVSFLQFDVSGLTVDDVNQSTFEASFQIDYLSRVNSVNSMQAFVGRNVSGTWDSGGSNNPLHDWGWNDDTTTVTALDGQSLVANIQMMAPPINDITVDVSSIVKGWVDGTHPNQGLVLYYDANEFQGAGFDNAELLVTIPEPSSFGLLVLGAGIAVAMRKRRLPSASSNG